MSISSNKAVWSLTACVSIFALGASQQCAAAKVMPYTSVETSLNENAVPVQQHAPAQEPTDTSTAWLTVIGMFAAAILFAGLGIHIITTGVALGVFTWPVYWGLLVLSGGLLYGSVVSAVRIASPRTTPIIVATK